MCATVIFQGCFCGLAFCGVPFCPTTKTRNKKKEKLHLSSSSSIHSKLKPYPSPPCPSAKKKRFRWGDMRVAYNVVNILSNHFPDRVKNVVFFHASGGFRFLWKMISPFLSSETKKKVHPRRVDSAVWGFFEKHSPPFVNSFSVVHPVPVCSRGARGSACIAQPSYR